MDEAGGLRRQIETVVFDQHGTGLAIFEGVALWPTVGSVVELRGRDAVVTEVRLRVHPPDQYPAQVRIEVEDPGDPNEPVTIHANFAQGR